MLRVAVFSLSSFIYNVHKYINKSLKGDKQISEDHNFGEMVLKRADAYLKRRQCLTSEGYVFDRIAYRMAQFLSRQVDVIREK